MGGGRLQHGRGGACDVLSLRKGGSEKVLAMLKGGHSKFWGSHIDGGGHKKFPLFNRGATKSYTLS